jgi:glycosyltransferase involved in cell wall biosynthesis
MPKVSVVIPLYQTERFIAGAIRSVQAQSFSDFEILVVDDGSTDDGPAIAERMGEPRLRVVRQENRGLAGARNSGVREAKGDYVAFLDADDLWTPDKLARHVAQLDGDPEIGVSFSASALIDDDGLDIGLAQRPRDENFSLERIFCRNPVGNGSAPVIRRAVFDSIAFFDETLRRLCWFDETFRQSEDIECWTRIAAAGAWRFGYVDAPLTRYRVSREGLSANVEKQLATWRCFRAKVALYAPRLEARAGDLAEAYQLRYLARRSIRSSQFAQALRLILAGLKLSPRMLAEEPARTVSTLAAALLGVTLPASLFKTLTRLALTAPVASCTARPALARRPAQDDDAARVAITCARSSAEGLCPSSRMIRSHRRASSTMNGWGLTK